MIVLHGTKGSSAKENAAKHVYEQEITVSCDPFRNTEQGVYFCGEDNLLSRASKAKATSA